MNLPNKITLIRIILIPFMVFFYLADFIPNFWGKIVALVIFIIAALTDMLDGQIARKKGLVTNFGKFFDSIADKLLTMSALLLVVCDSTVPAPYGVVVAIIIIGRELIISAFRQVAATKNFTLFIYQFHFVYKHQDISLPLLFLLSFFYSTNSINENSLFVFEIINYIFLGLATILTILSGANYLIKNWAVVKDNNKLKDNEK